MNKPLQIDSNTTDTIKLLRMVVDCATHVTTVKGFSKYLNETKHGESLKANQRNALEKESCFEFYYGQECMSFHVRLHKTGVYVRLKLNFSFLK